MDTNSKTPRTDALITHDDKCELRTGERACSCLCYDRARDLKNEQFPACVEPCAACPYPNNCRGLKLCAFRERPAVSVEPDQHQGG